MIHKWLSYKIGCLFNIVYIYIWRRAINLLLCSIRGQKKVRRKTNCRDRRSRAGAGVGPGRALPEEDGLEPELGRSWARLGQYLFFSVGARRWKKVQSVGGLHFFTRGTEEKKLAGQAGTALGGPGPGWAWPGPGRGQRG